MTDELLAGGWTVDLTEKLASRDGTLIRFSADADHGLTITFITGGDYSLEKQCLIAGEATAAIRAAMRRPA